ncbi:peptidoglycan DD-metalloendopeptidase family protein [Croceimicrobium hydrocarbonivorans]|uniref:Peptidoglycan DD-metalloendopeptidase family protein n=2 Tax=Croceimicrobium hydrocarbonivorans TaxID=2761580 RepID=A0A7H0VJX2_9FLAO|nr:peptidoglycan DD-metalloendopeptidase family protein [Croceimicrobium hydrocarbonivorans]
MKYGLPVDSFELIDNVISNGESFSNILLNFGIDYSMINRIATNYKDIFDVRNLRSGKDYTIFAENLDSNQVARYMVYKPSAIDYVVFDLRDTGNVYLGAEDVEVREKSISGVIESSLYESLLDQGGSPALAVELSKVYAWTIDFFRIQPGDYFKLIYEENYIQDSIKVGTGRILAADFHHSGRSFYSFFYDNDTTYRDYFDEEGRSLRKAFLKAPLDFFRISSRFNPRRFHPVLKRVKPHLGTDYAAPHGTPIMSTADGEVIAAAYTRGNGNYVKVRHNSTYTTQYLHMSKFAKGIRKGSRVRQGDVIGYVGSTGLATGPHVCYRFWVNGKQVDPLSQDLPEAEPITDEYMPSFQDFMMPLKKRIDALKLPLEEPKEPKVRLAQLQS